MRRVVYYITISVDGMYAQPDGSLDAFAPDEATHRYANTLMTEAGDMVMGRVMYGVMGYWDELDLDDPAVPDIEREFAEAWRSTPKHVVSRGTPELRANATKLEGDVVEVLRAMKAGDGPPIMVGGGAELYATVAGAGLIDDHQIVVSPLALGTGKPLFGGLGEPLRLRLVGTRTFDSGAVLLRYEPG